MVRRSLDRILLIGDSQRQVEAAVAQAMPAAEITHADSYFDGIAELSAQRFGAVVANAEPIERRPEAAIRALRDVARDSRVILFGHPTLEPVSRKMLEFGCDDYVITPPQPGELSKLLAAPVMRLAGEEKNESETSQHNALLDSVKLPDILLDALVAHPGMAIAAGVTSINDHIAPHFHLAYSTTEPPPVGSLSVAVKSEDEAFGRLSLTVDNPADEAGAHRFLGRAADTFAKLAALEDRHGRLTKLATTDQLTGVANRRFFEHFLTKLLEKALVKRFPVSLFLFDIDNFKKYNDEYGHGVGDEILKETATLMRLCCRKHDLVARIGGDEFAVVFWEKEGPRQPKDAANTAPVPTRVPEEPVQILKRFQKAISTRELSGLGASGRGTLTISGGLAGFPWDGRSVEELVAAADKALTFGAKRSGKNSIHLVGGEGRAWE